MVISIKLDKVGFIVEGASEKKIIESQAFRDFLKANGSELVDPVIDANGGGNLLPKYTESFIAQLRSNGAQQIFILTDLEDEASVEVVRQRVACTDVAYTFVSVKAIEAWFLADTQAMRDWLKNGEFIEPHPEQTDGLPWDRLKELGQQYLNRGPGTKVMFARKMLNQHGFTIGNAAKHEHCDSAKDLHDYLTAG